MAEDYDLSQLNAHDDKPWTTTLDIRLDMLIADAREHGMEPVRFLLPTDTHAYLCNVTGTNAVTHAGLPVEAHDEARVVLLCDRGDVSFNSTGWDVA